MNTSLIHKTRLFAVAACILAGSHLLAQFPKHEPDPAIQDLQFMVGEWEGKGWMEMPGFPRSHLISSEKVTVKIGGKALLIEGLHQVKLPDGKATIVHDAMAVVTSQGQGYRFQSWLANGQSGDYRGKLTDEAFVWGYENTFQGKVRYTIRINEKGEWFEIGEASKGGAPWKQFFEMTLRKKE